MRVSYGNAPGATGVKYPMNKSGGCNPGDELIGTTCYEMKIWEQTIPTWSGPPRDECVPGPARPQQSFFQRWEMPILGTLGVGVAALVYFSFKGGRR